ncbi:MAG: hypothetical protein MJZ20_11520 [Bacteroidaceae bacterium]|nr:hypothetical protein [Bacteroidaceae bacterium]
MILCAAIKFHIEKTDRDVIVPCWRHAEAFSILCDLGFEPKVGYKKIEEGFITTDNRFLNRVDAWEHAIKCGQINQTTRWYKSDHNEPKPHELFSEDLY